MSKKRAANKTSSSQQQQAKRRKSLHLQVAGEEATPRFTPRSAAGWVRGMVAAIADYCEDQPADTELAGVAPEAWYHVCRFLVVAKDRANRCACEGCEGCGGCSECDAGELSAEDTALWHMLLLRPQLYLQLCGLVGDAGGQGVVPHFPHRALGLPEAARADRRLEADRSIGTLFGQQCRKIAEPQPPPPHAQEVMASSTAASSTAEQLGAVLHLRVKAQDGGVVFFRLAASTTLGKLMRSYCERRGVSEHELRFLFKGWRVLDHQTPASVGMQDNDVVHVIQAQRGC